MTARRTRVTAGVMLGAVVVALAAGSAAAGSTQTTRLPLRANALCARGVQRMKSVPVPASKAAFLAYLKTELRLGESLLTQLARLRPPAGLKARVDRAFDLQRAFERRVRTLIGNLRTSRDPKTTVERAEPALNSLARKAGAAWRKAGLSKCAA